MGFGGDTLSDNQVGALHESLADILRAVVAVAWDGTAVPKTWRVGEGIFDYNVSLAFRSFINPASDFLYANPANDWYPWRFFGSDVAELNSTILSHAYYLLIFGGRHANWAEDHIPDFSVTALNPTPAAAELRAREIFMRAFQASTMASTPDFKKMKAAAMAQALNLYGSAAQTSVKKAFEAVGICHENTSAPTSAPDVSIFDLMCAGRFNTTWPAMPGVSRYYAEVAPANLGWAFSAPVTDVDGGTNHCFFRVAGPALYRIRACNSCGCGPWSDTEYLPYRSPCP